MGISASHSACTACVETCTLPIRFDLADLADSHLLQQLLLILDLQHRPALPQLHSLRVQIQWTQLAPRRHHRPHLALRRLAPRQIE
jgi:hypothetical protein